MIICVQVCVYVHACVCSHAHVCVHVCGCHCITILKTGESEGTREELENACKQYSCEKFSSSKCEKRYDPPEDSVLTAST